MALNQYSFKANQEEIKQLERFAAENNYHWEQHSAPGVKKRFSTGDCVVTVYQKGTILIQGKGTGELLNAVWPHRSPRQRNRGDLPGVYIGADESGKGDYFGPLVVAAVAVNPAVTKALENLGVRDSKRLNDKQVRALSLEIEELCSYRVRLVEPVEYNRIYTQTGNLNHLLAELHSETIASLLAECRVEHVVIDQFAVESTMRRKITLPGVSVRFFPQAESISIGVAAASIVARNYFLAGLESLSRRYDIELPKGAVHVVKAGKELIKKHGPDVLSNAAKLHFQTTSKILN